MPTGLGQDNRRASGIVTTRLESLDNVAGNEDGRVAHVVVDCFESQFDRLPVLGRKHLHLQAERPEGSRDQGGIERGKEWGNQGFLAVFSRNEMIFILSGSLSGPQVAVTALRRLKH